MSGLHKQQRHINVGSMLLTPQENDYLFNHLGRKCITLSSGVVQVFTADRNATWTKRCCGVACLIKDNPQRSYFIRVFDVKDSKMLFEQELYNNFNMNPSRPYFITFAGDSSQVGLNFASEEEAKRFRGHLAELLGKRQRKTEKRREPPNGPTLPMATVDIENPEISTGHRFHSNSQVNNIIHSTFKREKKGKGKKKRLTKADIGTQSNFQHIGHVGWDPNTGFDLNNLDPELKHLFDMCGISEAQLKDKETSKVIYDFIEKKGGVEAVKNELRRQEKRREPPNGPTLPMATVDIENPEISTGHRFHSNSQVNNIIHSTFKREKKGKGKKKRLTKADIGTQSNFQHIGHVGWDPNTGFDLNNLDPELKNLFDMCGISEAQLKDKETSKVIYDFIEKKGGVEAVKNELRRQSGPHESALCVASEKDN
ncbi:actin nucleation-promoting factor WASL-like isoform X2 [Phyllopteryx taeniolatus]|uniref:actin nucleation-promoting factor WASL-like isoform X2 n=1 Tax=Phyllopteryx taeniolatus TaxID=161469 RepID=UPI002AD385E8|nr:actin nucleation-promoting factor WASL-like isoform X2 [Phyllopteryx taeniolatus]